MPYVEEKIRFLSLGIVKKDDRLFLCQGFDPIKQEVFYRAMGGGIEFGETSLEALRREFFEEIKAEITNIRYLGCLESIFMFRGQPGHEIIQLYECEFVDPYFYKTERLTFQEGEKEKTALWIDINLCKSGELKIVPCRFLNYV